MSLSLAGTQGSRDDTTDGSNRVARIHPSIPQPGTPRGERIVFEYLKEGLPDDWILVHGREFTIPRRGRHPDEGEVDFLVLDPSRGLVALEVKGGTIERTADGWFSTSEAGERNRIKNPAKQAKRAIHSLVDYARDRDRQLANLRFGWGVVFPEVDANGDLGVDLPRRLLIDRSELGDPRRSVGRVFEESGVDGPPLDEGGIRAFEDIFLPRFHLARSLRTLGRPKKPLGEEIEAQEREFVRLAREQMQILEFNGHVPRLAIEGGAGTGKTLVALEQARRLAVRGDRVLMLCYNSALARALAKETEDVLDVWSFHALCRDRALAAGLGFDPSGSEAFWDDTAPELLLQALDADPDDRWDAVIVDEGQDFADHWWLVVQALLADPGEGTLWVFHDPAQNIFERESWTEIARMQTARLPRNCRNTQAIGRHAYGTVELEPDFLPGAPEGLAVDDVVCADEGEMLDGVRKAIHRLLVEEGLDPARVVVLSTRSERTSAVWNRRTFGNYELAPYPAEEPNTVGFATLQRFKGLEADAVILCEIAPGEPHSTPSHVYVGASRAKHALVVVRYEE